MSALERQVEMSLQHTALPQAPAIAAQANLTAVPQTPRTGSPKITIEKLYVQAEEFREAYDMFNKIVHMVYEPEEATV
jgi:hypothetical protein